MKYGLSIPPFGPYSEPRYLAEIAREAEEAGWDGFFIWDHVIYFHPYHPLVDPWVALAAIAMNTERIWLGPLVTSLARRRPWKVARETVSIDRLSGGRLIMGVGLGEPAVRDFGIFGEEEDDKLRARKLDEGLDILDGLWSGEPFRFDGEFYTLGEVTFVPTPTQLPRIPVWVGGGWNKRPPMRRAARWDGFFPLKSREMITLKEWISIVAYLESHRKSDAPFDLVQGGTTPGDDPTRSAEIVGPFAEIGLTWWIENIDPWRFGLPSENLITTEIAEVMNERIRQGPPYL